MGARSSIVAEHKAGASDPIQRLPWPFVPEAAQGTSGLTQGDRWHAAGSTALPLAAAARSAIEILTDTANVERLRRCANPGCSMLEEERSQTCLTLQSPPVTRARCEQSVHCQLLHPAERNRRGVGRSQCHWGYR
jgi:hypothetical protein